MCAGVCVFVLGGGHGGEGGVMQPPRPRRVALTRTFPGQWSLYVFEEDDQRYQLLQSVRVCSRCHELPQTSLYDSIFCSGGSSSTRLVCWYTSTVYNPLCFHVSRLVNVCVCTPTVCWLLYVQVDMFACAHASGSVVCDDVRESYSCVACGQKAV